MGSKNIALYTGFTIIRLMLHRLVKVWLVLGWLPVAYLAYSDVLIEKPALSGGFEDYIIYGILINPILVLALNYIFTGRVTFWYKNKV